MAAHMEQKASSSCTFTDLNLCEWIVNQCYNMGLVHPTPVQLNCIPPILEGRDCIGCAKTGSGKTLAFALPILQTLCEDPYGIYALIITPTRELAFQIADQFRVLGKPIGLKDCIIVGGMDMIAQAKQLSTHPHIVISTPGRLADHLESCNTFTLKRIKYLVLDEADRLLEPGKFGNQLTTIFDALPKQFQTLLFSATITESLSNQRTISIKDPFFWESKSAVATVEHLDQRYILCPSDVKTSYFVHIVHNHVEQNPKSSIIVFVSTCKMCQVLSMMLNDLGLECMTLHSMISQKERLASLAKFKSNVVRILIATDVASRGLDIPTVALVINHNVPKEAKDYIHRVGRTARAGRGGKALTLVTQHDIKLLHSVEDLIGKKLCEKKINESEVLKILTQVAVAQRETEIKLDEMDFGENQEINRTKKRILEEGSSKVKRKKGKERSS